MFGLALPVLLKWWKLGLGIIVGAALCFPLAQCSGKKIGRAQMQHAIDAANLKALSAQHLADERAANQHLTDTIAVNRQEGALRDAISHTPDSAPDATRIALGCQRLRASGARAADLPAACRSGGGAQAGPAR
jgi:hypothetical protein